MVFGRVAPEKKAAVRGVGFEAGEPPLVALVHVIERPHRREGREATKTDS